MVVIGQQWRESSTLGISPYRIVTEMKSGEIYNKSGTFLLYRDKLEILINQINHRRH